MFYFRNKLHVYYYRKLKNKINIEVNLAYYRKKDWRKFLELIDDREYIHETWKEWNKSYLKAKQGLISQGLTVNDFVVDLNVKIGDRIQDISA